MLRVVRRVLQALLVLNWVVVAAFILFGIVLIAMPGRMATGFAEDFGQNGDAVRQAMIGMMAVGSTVAIPAHIIFSRLIAMIDTVCSGRPFISVNAVRLRHIAWAMLAIQIVDMGFGWFAMRLSEASGQSIGWQFSITGWLSVLLLFVLARVFQQGAAMQDEIEATV